MKLNKKGIEKLNNLLNNKRVNNYHKTLCKCWLNNSNNNNLQKADMDIMQIVINNYNGVV